MYIVKITIIHLFILNILDCLDKLFTLKCLQIFYNKSLHKKYDKFALLRYMRVISTMNIIILLYFIKFIL